MDQLTDPQPWIGTIRSSLCPARLLALGCALVTLGATTGCATLGPKPWEHDLLSERTMLPDPHPVETSMDDHIYFSKEASSGGRSFAGGGCGCN